MKSCTFELIVNILTYAIKNNQDSFSQKDFKNVVYTKEFNNYDINEKIADGCEYLLKRGLLQLESNNMTFFEKYKLPETIKINTENYTKVFKELSKRIILMHEGKEMINDTYEVKDDYADVIEAVDLVNSGFLSHPDKEEIKVTLSKILISFNVESNAHYSLLTIIQLLELKSAMKIRIKTKTCEFAASNIKFNHLQFNDDSMIVYFDKCSFEIDSIEDILHIDSIDNSSLEEHINKSIEILNNYPQNKTEKIIEFLKKN
ncbi:hypothetical protein [Arcobacter sp. LA11]|uniref:hypothetical protein n=1 Tax=Arcobacter sp. LA11 TaxID=1898176 RepID=UPI000934C811|nr:hypothetical protein [Arcobacter sp. LA11]